MHVYNGIKPTAGMQFLPFQLCCVGSAFCGDRCLSLLLEDAAQAQRLLFSPLKSAQEQFADSL